MNQFHLTSNRDRRTTRVCNVYTYLTQPVLAAENCQFLIKKKKKKKKKKKLYSAQTRPQNDTTIYQVM